MILSLRLFTRKLKQRNIKFIIVIVFVLWALKLLVSLNKEPDAILLDDDSKSSFFEYIHRSNLKSIQLYTPYFEKKDWNLKLGGSALRGCPGERRCFVFRLADHKQQRALEESDGVIVHGLNLISLPKLDAAYNRRSAQIWSFYSLESQQLTYCLKNYTLADLDDWFNLTFTPKSPPNVYSGFDLKKIDKYVYYYEMFNLARLFQSLAPFYHFPEKKKVKMALWFVSNCETINKREDFVKELGKYIDIDIYGGGDCKFKNYKKDPCYDSAFGKDICSINLFKLYKFYLSFENSNCDSYITEKYFKLYYPHLIYFFNILPVVRGPKLADYLSVAPDPYSFIHVDSFASPKHLADYLNYLDNNDTAYFEYFKWKQDIYAKLAQKHTVNLQFSQILYHLNYKSTEFDNPDFLLPFNMAPLCELCAKLHDPTFSNNKISTIKMTEIYNPVKDCQDQIMQNGSNETTSEKWNMNCFWSEYFLK